MADLIPRKVFFDNQDKTDVRVSPDGRYISYLAPHEGVLNVWIAPRSAPNVATVITRDQGRGIRLYGWAFSNQHIIYLQDTDGDENWRLYAVEIDSREVRDLTPFEKVQAQPFAFSPEQPETCLIGLNRRNPQWHDVYRLNIVTGELSLLEEHERFSGFIADKQLRLRLAVAPSADGGNEIYLKDREIWTLWDSISAEDAMVTFPLGFNSEGNRLFIRDSRRRNTAALTMFDVNTGQLSVLADDLKADADNVLFHPSGYHPQAVSFNYERESWKLLDLSLQADFNYLATLEPGDFSIVSRSLADDCWSVRYSLDTGPAKYYLYEPRTKTATYLFSDRQALEGLPLSPMQSFVMQARDGLELVGYYSLPVGTDGDDDGIPDQPLPLVFTPHGGPWWRDSWGYHPWHQWLANRGYAVLSVNFRASTGFGKAHLNAGDLEWGGKIIDDQVDAVRYMIDRGIADPSRIVIMGGSFGGYSTLAGMTFHPELYAGGVDLVGPSNLMTFIESVPAYWRPLLEMLYQRVGDPRTEDGRALLSKHSPIRYVERISKPLLIAQGANDPRVVQGESDQIVAVMKEKKLPVTYLLYPDEGHGFARPENNLSFYAIVEVFLAQVLGGHCEAIGDDLKGSSVQIIEGAEHVTTLSEALT